MEINYKSKLAIVTGSSSGIGSAIVQAFLNDGYSVVGIDVNSKDMNHMCSYTHHLCDVTDYTKLQSIIDGIGYCEINTLINCAGIREICPISELSIDTWEKVISVNVSSVFVASKAFAEKITSLKLRGGSIVNIASVSGLLGEPDRTAYVTSKHAVIGLTKQLAIEYGKYDLRCNAVAPGVIRTPLTEDYYHDYETLKKITSGQFVNYYATPDDITPLVLFLASDKSKFITGSTFVADGGWTAGKLI